jgi:hypothetical protein
MIKFKPTTGLIGILIASMLVISCGGKGGTGKKSKEDVEANKLVDEQKKLVEDFNQKYNLTPEQVKKFEEKLTKLKNEKSVEELDAEIKELAEEGTQMSTIIKEFEQANKTTDNNKKQEFLEKFKKKFPKGVTVNTVDEAKTFLLDLLNQQIQQKAGFQLKDLNQFTQFMSDSRLVLENIKKQVELKNKDKKQKDKA